jgi:hypothetical protein
MEWRVTLALIAETQTSLLQCARFRKQLSQRLGVGVASGACEWVDRSVPRGKYYRNSKFVFFVGARCQGLCGSQK